MGRSLSRKLAEFATEFSLDALEPDLAEKLLSRIKLHLLDYLGVCLSSTRIKSSKIVLDTMAAIGGHPESTTIGFGVKLPAVNAAVVNGALSHTLDYDDTHLEALLHPSCVTATTALTVGEKHNVEGRRVLEALIAGTEVMVRLGAVAPAGFHARGYHPTPICGALAAATIAGKLMGLGAEEMSDAIGIAGSKAAGLLEFLSDGSWTKRVHPGWASHAGIVSAMLAQRGFKGPRTVLEGKHGLYNSHLGEGNYRAARLTEGLGERWHLFDISFKLYPCCHLIHSYLDAVSHLQAQHAFSADEVQEVVLTTPPGNLGVIFEPLQEKLNPSTPYSAKFSCQYAVGSILVRGRASIQDFTHEAIRDPQVLEVAKRVKYAVAEDPEYPRHLTARVEVKTKRGSFAHTVKDPIGSPDNPATPRQIEEKFRNNAMTVMGEGAAQAVIEAVSRLEKVESVAELVALCTKTKTDFSSLAYLDE